MNNKTIQYYDNNSQAFYARSINPDLSSHYKAFLKFLPIKAHILDAGCGVGRDSKGKFYPNLRNMLLNFIAKKL